MKALIKDKNEAGLTLLEIAEPTIGARDVLIKVIKTGICGTDLHIYEWDDWASNTIKVPLTIGHEFVGKIVELGSDVKSFSVGDLVSGEGHLVCGQCRNCLAGRRHLCSFTLGLGVNRDGAFAEYVSIPESNVWLHDKDVNMDVAAIFDPFGNAVHTAYSFSLLGEDVVVTGAGPIGIMSAIVARHAGARNVVITDPNPYRRELAKKFGVTLAIDPTIESLAEVQKKLGMKIGFDVGFEMSGNGTAFKEMICNMAHGGKIALLGIPAQGYDIDWKQVIFKMLTLKGIYGREMFETWYQMNVLTRGGLDISPIITHQFHFSEYEDAFKTMKSKESGKIILNWE